MPENQPQVRLFDNLRDRFEEGGLPYLPNFSKNTYNDLSETSEYDPVSDVSDRKQPDNPQGQPDDYSRLDGVGTDGIVNKYYDGEVDTSTGINPTEYDPVSDASDRKQPDNPQGQAGDYSRLDGVGTDGMVNKYYDSEDFELVAGGVVNGQPVIQAANVTEYDANIDVSDRKQPFISDYSLDYSRLDLRGPENDNTYGPESGYYGSYESRTGTFKDYE